MSRWKAVGTAAVVMLVSTVFSAIALPLPSHLTPTLRRALVDYERGRYDRPNHSIWVRIAPGPEGQRLDIYATDAPDDRMSGFCKIECSLLTVLADGKGFRVLNDAYVEPSQIAVAAPGSAERLYTGNGPEPSVAFAHINPVARRFVIDEMKHVFDADSERHDPSSVVSAPLVLKGGHKAVAIKVSRGWLCSATGMCPLLVLVPQGTGFRMVGDLEGQGPLRVLPHYTNGYPDLTDWVHDSAYTNFEIRYWFNGKKYVEGERRNGWVEKRGGDDDPTSRRLPLLPEGKLLIGEEVGEPLYK